MSIASHYCNGVLGAFIWFFFLSSLVAFDSFHYFALLSIAAKSVLQIFVCILISHNLVFAFVSIFSFFCIRSAFSTGRWQNFILISINFNRMARFLNAILFVVIFSISLSWSAVRLAIKRKAIERVFSPSHLLGHRM